MSPILNEHNLDFISHSQAQTRRLGARLGELLQAGDVICLVGELGTGKTCLTQGIGRGMGVTSPITSPTFTLIGEYRSPDTGLTLYHVDFYRLADATSEAVNLGVEDYLYGDGVCVIEWADRAATILPGERLWITLRHVDDTKRELLMEARGERYLRLLRDFRQRAFGV